MSHCLSPIIDPTMPIMPDEQLSDLQRAIATKVVLQPLEQLPRFVVGVDAAYAPDRVGGGTVACGAAVVIDTSSFEVVEQATATNHKMLDYQPGFLAFREAPVLLEAIAKLRRRPELIVCDGQGIAHPAKAGLACHVGVALDVPTIGCAKNRLVGEHETVGQNRGDSQSLQLTETDGTSTSVGAAVRTRDHVKCVFVSPGHMVDVPTSVAHVLALAPQFRLPETTRAADQLCRAALAGHEGRSK